MLRSTDADLRPLFLRGLFTLEYAFVLSGLSDREFADVVIDHEAKNSVNLWRSCERMLVRRSAENLERSFVGSNFVFNLPMYSLFDRERWTTPNHVFKAMRMYGLNNRKADSYVWKLPGINQMAYTGNDDEAELFDYNLNPGEFYDSLLRRGDIHAFICLLAAFRIAVLTRSYHEQKLAFMNLIRLTPAVIAIDWIYPHRQRLFGLLMSLENYVGDWLGVDFEIHRTVFANEIAMWRSDPDGVRQMWKTREWSGERDDSVVEYRSRLPESVDILTQWLDFP